MQLIQRHRDELRASGLTDETIEASSIHSELNASRIAEMLNQNVSFAAKLGLSMVIPYYAMDGSNGYSRVKPETPLSKKRKYESPKDQPNKKKELANSWFLSSQ